MVVLKVIDADSSILLLIKSNFQILELQLELESNLHSNTIETVNN